MAHRSDRRGDVPITALAYEAGHSIGSPRADFHDGPELTALHQRPKIRLQSDCVCESGMTPERRNAPRASRPFGRLRRCATRSLDPCSRCSQRAAMRRRRTFVAHRREVLISNAPSFFLTEESRYRLLDGTVASSPKRDSLVSNNFGLLWCPLRRHRSCSHDLGNEACISQYSGYVRSFIARSDCEFCEPPGSTWTGCGLARWS